MGEEAWVHHAFEAFPRCGWELCLTEWKFWVSLAFRQTRHWLHCSCFFLPGLSSFLLDLPFWPVIHESHCRFQYGWFNQRVISGHRLEIERVMVLPTHVTVTDHSPDFFLFSGGRSIPWAALAFLRARKSVNVSFGRWRVRCECGAGDDSPVLSWLLQYGC